MTGRRVAVWFLVSFDVLLLLALIYLSFGQQRMEFGRSTGLVTSCAVGVGHGMRNTWSPLVLLIIAVPAVASLVILRRRWAGDVLRMGTTTVVGVLLLVAVLLVLVPFGGTCVA